MTELQPKEIAVRSGLRFSYVERGDPSGTPVILLHGYTDSWRSYAPLLAELPLEYRAIAVTQRGHGESSKPDGLYRIADLAADVSDVMDALGLPQAVVAGHSMGSLVASRFALDWPERTLALVLIGAFRTLKGNEGAEALWQQAVAALADPVYPAFVRMFQESTLARPVPPVFLDTVIAESLKAPARVWRGALRAMLDDDFSGELAEIDAPTLIVWGDRDELCSRAEATALAAAIPGATLEVHPGSGHAPHWEDPALVARQMADFIADRIARGALLPQPRHRRSA